MLLRFALGVFANLIIAAIKSGSFLAIGIKVSIICLGDSTPSAVDCGPGPKILAFTNLC